MRMPDSVYSFVVVLCHTLSEKPEHSYFIRGIDFVNISQAPCTKFNIRSRAEKKRSRPFFWVCCMRECQRSSHRVFYVSHSHRSGEIVRGKGELKSINSFLHKVFHAWIGVIPQTNAFIILKDLWHSHCVMCMYNSCSMPWRTSYTHQTKWRILNSSCHVYIVCVVCWPCTETISAQDLHLFTAKYNRNKCLFLRWARDITKKKVKKKNIWINPHLHEWYAVWWWKTEHKQSFFVVVVARCWCSIRRCSSYLYVLKKEEKNWDENSNTYDKKMIHILFLIVRTARDACSVWAQRVLCIVAVYTQIYKRNTRVSKALSPTCS